MRSKELIQKLTEGKGLTLTESIVVPEVGAAVNDWVKASPDGQWLLIGGNVVGFYTRPRATMDVDVLFRSEEIPPQVVGFKRTRHHAFQHNDTHVEVEALTPGFINLSPELVRKVFDTATEIHGVSIPSPSGLVALKLVRSSLQDIADIEAIAKNQDVDLSGWPVEWEAVEKAESLTGQTLTKAT